ncbi:hypothetical protein D3C80_916760 [compost metagenome]
MGVDIDEPHLDFGDPVRIGRGFGLCQKRAALLVGGKHDGNQRIFRTRCFLRDLADARLFGDRHRTAFGRKIAGDDPEQGGFAGAVAADKARLHASRKCHARMVEKQAPGDAGGKIGNRNHGVVLAELGSQGKSSDDTPGQIWRRKSSRFAGRPPGASHVFGFMRFPGGNKGAVSLEMFQQPSWAR